MTCILTDEEILGIYCASEVETGRIHRDLWRAIANAAARKALELAARECDECREAIRELARGYE